MKQINETRMLKADDVARYRGPAHGADSIDKDPKDTCLPIVSDRPTEAQEFTR
jgi:hypothetical protein